MGRQILVFDLTEPEFKEIMKDAIREVLKEEKDLSQLEIDEDKLLLPGEVKKILNCSDKQLYSYRKNRGLPYIKSNPNRYRLKDVMDFRHKLMMKRIKQ